MIALLLSVQILFAQSYKKRTPEEKARFYTDEMVKTLNLDSVTSVGVYEINLLVSRQFDSLYATSPEKEDARKGAVAIYKNRDLLLRKVLTTQQFLQFDDIQREKREKKKLERAQENAKKSE